MTPVTRNAFHNKKVNNRHILFFAVLVESINTMKLSNYDWANQTSFPKLGIEIARTKGGSEVDTLSQNLYDVPMSEQDLQQYYQYYFGEEIGSRPPGYQKAMGICLRNMATSSARGDESSYYMFREQFLDMDSSFRTYEQVYGKEAISEVKGQEQPQAAKNGDEEHHQEVNGEMNSKAAREHAVNQAWKKEAERVLDGKGTWDWTVEQQAELLKRGKVSGFEGSHMLNAKDYPEHEGNPDNIQLIPTIAHFDGVHQRNTHAHNPNGVYDPNTGEVIPASDGRVPTLSEIPLTDRYDPEQQEFHDAAPAFEQSGEARRAGFIETKERHPEKSIKSGRDNSEGAEEAAEPEMNMAPTVETGRGAEEAAEPEMNMAPTVETGRGTEETAESEMNMAPTVETGRGTEETAELEMNMAPTAEEENVSSKQDNSVRPDSGNTVDGAAIDTNIQEQGMSW